MAGPRNIEEAGANGGGGQYVTVPGFATPGMSTPSNSREAPSSIEVYSPKGWRWVEAGDQYSKSVSKLTAATMEGAVRRIRSSMGEVFYIRGTADTEPPFPGTTTGDTLRVQDAQTLDIVAEWKWNGGNWERMRVSSEQISNLDVGRLTAGSASIAELAARKIAADVGRFLELTTDQLTVTGNASFVNAAAHHIWSKIVTSKDGEFEQIKAGMIAANAITANNIKLGALDGQIITGARIQTDKWSNRGVKIDSSGLRAYDSRGNTTAHINAHTGEIEISGRLGRQDSWSECFFNDVVYTETGSDVDRGGNRIGVGLGFRSKIDDWKDGTISMERTSSESARIVIRSPEPANFRANIQPSLTIGHQEFYAHTGYSHGSYHSIIELKPNRFNVDIGQGSIYYSGDNFSVLRHGKHIIYSTGQAAGIYASYGQYDGVWIDKNNGIGFKYGISTKYWIDSDGFHIGGNKKFTMLVPEMSKARGGMRLEHSATESPYDGIEYWENLTIGPEGKVEWTLPDYVPKIASKKAPWVVFTNTEAKAVLDRSNSKSWKVVVAGNPGESVSVLVKGARMIDKDVDSTGEPIMRDYARESPWALPAPDAPIESEASPQVIGGGYYGPALKHEEKEVSGSEHPTD